MSRKPHPDASPATRFALTVDTPLGTAALVFTAEPLRLHEVILPPASHDEIPDTPLPDPVPDKARALARAVAGYFHGSPLSVPWDMLDTTGLTPGHLAVLAACADIEYGQTRSYGQVAAEAGRPGAARFVGNCMANNPFPLFIPCHRVIRADGSLGGFGRGTIIKKHLLDTETRHRPNR